MKVLKVLFQFYINSSCHVALSVGAFTYLSAIQLGIPVAAYLLFFVFFATILGYNFVKYLGFIALLKQSEIQVPTGIVLISVMAAMMLFIFIGNFSVVSIAILAFMAGLTFLYAMPLSFKKQTPHTIVNLRGLSGVKVFIIAFVWSVTTALLPALEAGLPCSLSLILMLLQRFVWVLVLMIPFEIRDLKYDHPSLATWPQNFGVRNTKIIGTVLLTVILLLEISNGVRQGTWFWILLIMVLITCLMIWQSKREQSFYYSAFWVEGIPILWLAMLLLFR